MPRKPAQAPRRPTDKDTARLAHRAITVPMDQVELHKMRNAFPCAIVGLMKAIGDGTDMGSIPEIRRKAAIVFDRPGTTETREQMADFMSLLYRYGTAIYCGSFPADLCLSTTIVHAPQVMMTVGGFVDEGGLKQQLETAWGPILTRTLDDLVFHEITKHWTREPRTAVLTCTLLLEIHLTKTVHPRYECLGPVDRRNPEHADVVSYCYALKGFERAIRGFVPMFRLDSKAECDKYILMTRDTRNRIIFAANTFRNRSMQPQLAPLFNRYAQIMPELTELMAAATVEERAAIADIVNIADKINKYEFDPADIPVIEAALGNAETVRYVYTLGAVFLDADDAIEPVIVAPPAAAEVVHHHDPRAIDRMLAEADPDSATEVLMRAGQLSAEGLVFDDDLAEPDHEAEQAATNARTLKRKQLLKAKKQRELAEAEARRVQEAADIAVVFEELIGDVCAKVIHDRTIEEAAKGIFDELVAEIFADYANSRLKAVKAQATVLAVARANATDLDAEFMAGLLDIYAPSLVRFARVDEGVDPLMGSCQVCLEPYNFGERKPFHLKCCAQTICGECLRSILEVPHGRHALVFDRDDALLHQWVVLRRGLGLPVPRYEH